MASKTSAILGVEHHLVWLAVKSNRQLNVSACLNEEEEPTSCNELAWDAKNA